MGDSEGMSGEYRVSITSPCTVLVKKLTAIVGKQEKLIMGVISDDYNKAVLSIDESNSDIVAVDIASRFVGDCGLVKGFRDAHPSLPILVYTACNELLYAKRCIQLGANGYVMVYEPKEKIIRAINTVFDNNIYLSSRVRKRLRGPIDFLRYDGDDPLTRLTPRENQVFGLLLQWLSHEEMAEHLEIKVATVTQHLSHILDRLDLINEQELQDYASMIMLKELYEKRIVKG